MDEKIFRRLVPILLSSFENKVVSISGRQISSTKRPVETEDKSTCKNNRYKDKTVVSVFKV